MYPSSGTKDCYPEALEGDTNLGSYVLAAGRNSTGPHKVILKIKIWYEDSHR